jgi:uncharacterized protein YigE (DUF2233 family)
MHRILLSWLALIAAATIATATFAQAGCSSLSRGGEDYTVCSYDPALTRIETFSLDKKGKPLEQFNVLRSELAEEGKKLTFATNAGMFGEDLKPIGLYVENGKTQRKLSRRNGYGNFHLKPNGVFYMKGGKPFVQDTEAFARSGVKPDFATQSGPMLVINGALHPKFSENGPSEKIRNGVGVDGNGQLVFVKSETAVNFHEFASLFRDQLACKNALFFDGSVSSLYSTELGRNDGFIPLGPMVGIYEFQ